MLIHSSPPATHSTASPWAKILGPCFTADSLRTELGLTPAEAADASASLRVLSLKTADDVEVFPAFQFVNGKPVRGLNAVLEALSVGTDDRWTWAQWLNTPRPAEPRTFRGTRVHNEDRSTLVRNIDCLASGDVDGTVTAARRTAASWAS